MAFQVDTQHLDALMQAQKGDQDTALVFNYGRENRGDRMAKLQAALSMASVRFGKPVAKTLFDPQPGEIGAVDLMPRHLGHAHATYFDQPLAPRIAAAAAGWETDANADVNTSVSDKAFWIIQGLQFYEPLVTGGYTKPPITAVKLKLGNREIPTLGLQDIWDNVSAWSYDTEDPAIAASIGYNPPYHTENMFYFPDGGYIIQPSQTVVMKFRWAVAAAQRSVRMGWIGKVIAEQSYCSKLTSA